jgi:hypothetical protein
MGLDMYLTAKRSFERGLKVVGMDPVAKVDTVIVNLGEWRKAYHIHGWFVKNVQKGQDNCAAYWVEREKLQELLEICQLVIKNRHLTHLFPPVKGGYDIIDETYFKQILDTVNIIKTCFTLPECWEFYYEANW